MKGELRGSHVVDVTFVVRWVQLESGTVLHFVRDVLPDPEVAPYMECVEADGVERAPLSSEEFEACIAAADAICDGGSDELIRMAQQTLQKQGRW